MEARSVSLTPYPYQAEAIERMREQARQGHRAICLILPTGGGKSVIASLIVLNHLEIAKRLGRFAHVLFVAHRTELISQAARTMRDAGVERVRTINAGRATGDENPQVTVASVQTLSGVKWRSNLPDASLLVFDETHHVKSSTWLTIAERYKSSTRIGLTATPERADGSALGDVYTAIVEVASTRQLIDLGFLAPCDVYAPTSEGKALAENPIAAYEMWGGGRRCVVFAPSVVVSRAIAEKFCEAGIPAASVDGTMNATARTAVLATFRSGATRVLVNAQLLTEGWDDPGVDVCIITRNPDHAGTYLQMVGRVLRIDRSRPDKRATLIDLRGTTIKHGLPDDEREWSLDGEPIRLSAKAPPCRQCSSCGYVAHPWQGPCPVCGFAEEVKEQKIDVDGRGCSLVERGGRADGESKAAHERRMREHYDALVKVALSKGYKVGWAWWRFKQEYPDAPNFRPPKWARCAPADGHPRDRERASGWACPRCDARYDDVTRQRWQHASRDRECEQCMLDAWVAEPTEGAAQ